MAFFQKTILKKYQAMLPEEQVIEAWQKYQSYFLNPEIQENIRHSKEEQFQEGFLRELFVKIFGYTLNPSPDFNLITEQKNETDSKKADGAIKLNGKVIGIIELKDHKTTDLKKVEPQAFQYKSQNKDARYVIISNFEKLRLYIDNATEYREWNLFSISKTDFDELYCCLAWSQMEKGVSIKMKKASVSIEKDVTDALYRDYSSFKQDLFEDILKNNQTQTQEAQLLLYKKTQKLLDRLLFIFFAEDGGLLPPNSMVEILNQWQQLKDLDAYTPLYNRIKQYFSYLDKGNDSRGIFAYNGGLFHTDEILDSLIISDDLLYKHTNKLADYNFKSDVDVNILGHIFEHSLSEIEEVTQRIMGVKLDASKSKRKKNGVFYTPPYITKYIVENTIGKLCSEKKQELGIIEKEYFSDRKRQKQTKQNLLEKLKIYREWLLQITILDPACGSGAFLNASLSFLMNEHHLIDEMEAKIRNHAMIFQDVENSILENNLYGVDINEESVELAQLALWLRTARPQRKLSSLNENIKCGNSLISDPNIAGEKAFDWEKEFPQVFAKGGFDVVIGNPPYVRAEIIPQADIDFYRQNYDVFTPDGDLFSYFYEKGLNLLQPKGIFGFISNTFDKTNAGLKLRTYLQNNTNFERYVDFTEVQIFEGATTYPIILLLSKCRSVDNKLIYTKIPKEMQGNVEISAALHKAVSQSDLDANNWAFQCEETASVIRKMNIYKTIREQYGKCYRGLLTGLNDAFIIDEKIKTEFIAQDINSSEILKPIYEGRDLHKWYNSPLPKYLICSHNGYENVAAINIDDYPVIKNHLFSFEPKLSNRYDKGNTPFNLRNCAYQSLFYQTKIIWGNLQNSNKFSWDEGSIISAPACMLPTSNKALLAVLNSKLVWCYLTNICVVRNGGYIEVKPQYFERIPIPPIKEEYSVLLESLTQKMLDLNKQLQEKRNRFLRRLIDNFEGIKIKGALSAFDQLKFADFLKELKKQKITLKLLEQDEWEDYFNDYCSICNELSEQIAETEKEIDLQVYKLYGLTYDEVLIIDANFSVNREMYEIYDCK